MNDFAEILKYTIPGLVILAVAWVMLKAFLENNRKNIELLERIFTVTEEKRNKETGTAPHAGNDFQKLQLQAYERMTLFLERINPVNLIPRMLSGTKTAGELQRLLLQTIREEYEHNLSQQIYLDETLWEMIKAAKESVVRQINSSAKSISAGEPAALLAEKILTSGFNRENNPVEQAVAALKKDLQKKYS